MTKGSARLVRGIQRKLLSVEPVNESGCAAPREVAELEVRLRRLRAMGERFAHIRLSDYVTSGVVTYVPCGVGGACVATEV